MSLLIPGGFLRTIAVVSAMLAVALVAITGDGAHPRVDRTFALQQPLYDRFDGSDYWYADYSYSGDLFPLSRSYSTAGATLEEGESAPCSQNVGATIWMRYWADRSGEIDIRAVSGDFDVVLAVYTWDMTGDFLPSPPGAKLEPVGCAIAGQTSGVSFSLVAGTEYFIQVGGQEGGSGNVTVEATCACAPPNDRFESSFGAYLDAYQPTLSYELDTTQATLQPGEQRPCGGIGATVWFEIYATNASTIELSTAGSDYDTVIAVYRDPDYSREIGRLRPDRCADAGANGSQQAALTLTLEEGGQYWLQIGGGDGASGNLKFSARCEPSCPPYNDNMQNAEYWDVPFTGHTIPTEGATLEAGEPQPCGDISHTVWLQVIARGNTRITLNTEGSDFETSVAVYENAAFSPPPGEFEMIDCDSGGAAAVEFAANGNQPYWVQIGGVEDASGMLVINADCVPSPCPPFHDSIVQPYWFWRPYGSEFYTEFFDVRGATTEPGEPLDCGDMGHTTWWVIDMYDPNVRLPFAFDTRDSDFDTEIAVYEAPLYGGEFGASPFASMTRIACSSDGNGNRARATFDAQPNKRYYVQIGGHGAAAGQLGVEISCNGPCPAENDMVGAALYAFAPFSHTIDTRATTTEPSEPLPCGSMGKTVWYRIDGGAGAEFTISTAGSDFPTVIAAYETPPWSSPPGGGSSDVGCVIGDTLEYAGTAGSSYLIQVGGVDGASGSLQLSINCEPVESCQQQVYPVDTGAQGGGVVGPDTGTGGHKASAAN